MALHEIFTQAKNWIQEQVQPFFVDQTDPWKTKLDYLLTDRTSPDKTAMNNRFVFTEKDGSIDLNRCVVSMQLFTGMMPARSIRHIMVERRFESVLKSATQDEVLAFLESHFSDETLAAPSHRQTYLNWKDRILAGPASSVNGPSAQLTPS